MKFAFALAVSTAITGSATAQQPLPPVPVPAQNPLTPAKATLGQMLFWEEQLAADNRMSCGTCHMPESGGSELVFAQHPGVDGRLGNQDDTFGSRGVRGADGQNHFADNALFGFDRQVTPRKAPTMIAAAYAPLLFWDGRADGRFVDPQTGQLVLPSGGALENQALQPILDHAEMGHAGRTWAEVTSKLGKVRPMALASNLPQNVQAALNSYPDYPALFQNAFGDPAITAARIAMALATYQRTLVPNQSPFDAFLAGNPGALTAAQARGRQLFNSPQTSCSVCHSGALLTDQSFRFNGLRPQQEDLGRFAVTGNPQDRGRFKVPTLRNVGLQRRFAHTGQFSSLAQIINFYNQPPRPTPGRDPLIRPLRLNGGQRADIEAFLHALTDPRVAAASGPFARPTLHSERVAIGSNQFGIQTFGLGGRPEMISEADTALGMPDFRIGMYGGTPGAMALLALGTAEAPFGTTVLGVPVAVDLPSAILYPTPLSADGAATLAVGIPNALSLVGLPVRAQWFVPDANLNFVASRAARWTLF